MSIKMLSYKIIEPLFVWCPLFLCCSHFTSHCCDDRLRPPFTFHSRKYGIGQVSSSNATKLCMFVIRTHTAEEEPEAEDTSSSLIGFLIPFSRAVRPLSATEEAPPPPTTNKTIMKRGKSKQVVCTHSSLYNHEHHRC